MRQRVLFALIGHPLSSKRIGLIDFAIRCPLTRSAGGRSFGGLSEWSKHFPLHVDARGRQSHQTFCQPGAADPNSGEWGIVHWIFQQVEHGVRGQLQRLAMRVLSGSAGCKVHVGAGGSRAVCLFSSSGSSGPTRFESIHGSGSNRAAVRLPETIRCRYRSMGAGVCVDMRAGASRKPAEGSACSSACLSYGWPFAPWGTCDVKRFRMNSRTRFATASPPMPAKPFQTTNEPPRSEAG